MLEKSGNIVQTGKSLADDKDSKITIKFTTLKGDLSGSNAKKETLSISMLSIITIVNSH